MSSFMGIAFMDWLVKAGVLRPEEKTRRVIIDVPYDGPVKIYIEDFADSSMLTLFPPDMSEAVIVREDRG